METVGKYKPVCLYVRSFCVCRIITGSNKAKMSYRCDRLVLQHTDLNAQPWTYLEKLMRQKTRLI